LEIRLAADNKALDATETDARGWMNGRFRSPQKSFEKLVCQLRKKSLSEQIPFIAKKTMEEQLNRVCRRETDNQRERSASLKIREICHLILLNTWKDRERERAKLPFLDEKQFA